MPRALFLALLALVLPLCAGTASVPREKYDIEIDNLGGTWRIIGSKINGEDDSSPAEDWCLVVRENRVTLTTTIGRWFYRIDPVRHPAHIDRLADGTPGAKSLTQGIYRLSGTRLTICWGRGDARPKAFASKPGMSTTLVELVRVK